jgi:plasmid stability protein
MATLTVRNLPDDVRDKLRVRAAMKGRSTEAEVRAVLADAVAHQEAPAVSPTHKRIERVRASSRPDPAAPQSETQVAKLERARAILRRHVAPDRSMVDEFLRERQAMWGQE